MIEDVERKQFGDMGETEVFMHDRDPGGLVLMVSDRLTFGTMGRLRLREGGNCGTPSSRRPRSAVS